MSCWGEGRKSGAWPFTSGAWPLTSGTWPRPTTSPYVGATPPTAFGPPHAHPDHRRRRLPVTSGTWPRPTTSPYVGATPPTAFWIPHARPDHRRCRLHQLTHLPGPARGRPPVTAARLRPAAGRGHPLRRCGTRSVILAIGMQMAQIGRTVVLLNRMFLRGQLTTSKSVISGGAKNSAPIPL